MSDRPAGQSEGERAEIAAKTLNERHGTWPWERLTELSRDKWRESAQRVFTLAISPVSVEGEDEGGWRAVANDFQRAMFDERRAVEAADYLIDLLKRIIGGGVVRDLDEAKAAYYAARNESRAQRASASPSSPTG